MELAGRQIHSICLAPLQIPLKGSSAGPVVIRLIKNAVLPVGRKRLAQVNQRPGGQPLFYLGHSLLLAEGRRVRRQLVLHGFRRCRHNHNESLLILMFLQKAVQRFYVILKPFFVKILFQPLFYQISVFPQIHAVDLPAARSL